MTYWWQWALLISAITGAAVSLLAFGYLLGLMHSRIVERLNELRGRIEELEPEEDDSSAIIETTPQLLERKGRAGKLNDDESAIVTVKSPREVKAEQDRKLQEELDKLGR